MVRTAVTSTNLVSVGYDEREQVLEVEFHSGGVYQYYEVPPAVYAGLMAASSHGSFFVHNIKDAGYRYRRVG